MATHSSRDTEHHPAVEEFISGDRDGTDELGAPPLADRHDPLLDGDRIHTEDESLGEDPS